MHCSAAILDEKCICLFKSNSVEANGQALGQDIHINNLYSLLLINKKKMGVIASLPTLWHQPLLADLHNS